MPERDPQNLNFYWCTKFVRSLYESGVRYAVISPGLRSTALTLAFVSHPGFEKIISIDERSAAFTALGIGKATGNPACLVCTSGTAAANYLPAVVEATNSGTPLLVTSADRPPHLRSIGATQTIDQLKLFGGYPVFFHEVGEPKESDKSILRLERVAIQAVNESIQKGGVSHINFPFSKPFEPAEDFLHSVKTQNKKHAKQSFGTYSKKSGNSELDHKFWSDVISSERTVLIIGPSYPNSRTEFVSRLAKKLEAPILVEPGSNIPSSKYTITGFDGFLLNTDIANILKPDLILRFGKEPVSKAINAYLENNAGCSQIRFSSIGLMEDQTLSVSKFVHLTQNLAIPEIDGSASKEWIKNWRKHQKAFFAFREEQLHPATPLTDGYVFHTISEFIPKKAFTMLSNSFPVRDISLFADCDGKEMYVNRGAAGIDGIISTSTGISMGLKKAGVLFIGDIAFLHDVNGLLNVKYVSEPLIIVVLNNAGGSIFKMFPIADLGKEFTPYFETPHDVSIAALCRAYKVDHSLISRPEQIITCFEKSIEKPGIHVLECITDAEDSMAQRRLLWDYSPT